MMRYFFHYPRRAAWTGTCWGPAGGARPRRRGGTFRAPFLDTRPKDWDALLRLNLHHVLSACALAAPRMQAGGRGGSIIINITTIEAHRAAPGFAVYAAAKAAVEQFARTLAVELAPDRIRVTTSPPTASRPPAPSD